MSILCACKIHAYLLNVAINAADYATDYANTKEVQVICARRNKTMKSDYERRLCLNTDAKSQCHLAIPVTIMTYEREDCILPVLLRRNLMLRTSVASQNWL